MKLAFILCACAALSCAVAHAQQQSTDSSKVLDELIFSANKIPELKSKVAQQVKVISSQEIVNLNAQNSADLIANSGVAAVQKSQQGGGSPQLRGFEASRVLLFIDGVRMNNLIYRAGHLQNILTVDNNMLERVEILLGPSSTVYGSDALGGVIHFKTKDPALSEKTTSNNFGSAYLRMGSVNLEKTIHADFNIGTKHFGSLTSITYSNFDDLKMGKRINPALGRNFGLRDTYIKRSDDNAGDAVMVNNDPYLQKYSGYSQLDVLQKFFFKPSDRSNHLLNFQLSTSSNIPRYDRLTDLSEDGLLRNAEWYYGPQDRLLMSYQFTAADFTNIADALKATVSYQKIKESRHNRRLNSTTRRNQIEDVNVIAVTIDLQKSVRKHLIRYGFDTQFNYLNSSAYNLNIVSNERSKFETRYASGDNSMHVAAIYITHAHDLSPKVTINDGVRFGYSNLRSEFVDKTFFPFPFDEVVQRNRYASGNLGLVYRPNKVWKLSLSTSTGYRVPNIDDLAKVFESQAGQALIVPNPDVAPEKTINFDFAITKLFSNKLRWENTFYYTSFIDAIVLDNFEFNGRSSTLYDGELTPVFANQNKSKAFLYGYTTSIYGELNKNFKFDASFNYTYGRVIEESKTTPLSHIPPTFGRLSLQHQVRKLQSEVFINFNGWKKIDQYLLNSEDNEQYAPEEGMPRWYTVNMRFNYALTSSILIQAGIDNLLDLQYRTFSSGINAPGRNLFGTVRVAF